LDTDYWLFADTISGIIDLQHRRIKGLVVENVSKNKGSFDFCRVMANEILSEHDLIRCSSLRLFFAESEQSEHQRRIINASERANNKADEDQKRRRGLNRKAGEDDKRLRGHLEDGSVLLRTTFKGL